MVIGLFAFLARNVLTFLISLFGQEQNEKYYHLAAPYGPENPVIARFVDVAKELRVVSTDLP